MGDKTHHRSLCTWKKYGTKRPTIHSAMPQMPSRNGRQNTHTQVPSNKRKETMDNQHTETQPLDERPRNCLGSTNGNNTSTRTMDQRRYATNRQPIFHRKPTMDWLGQDDGWVAFEKLARPSRKNMEVC